MKNGDEVEFSISGITTRPQADSGVQVQNPRHDRVRIAVAVYNKQRRRYEETDTVKLRVSKTGRPALLKKIRDKLAELKA
jgi:hypothetical protein